MKVALVYDRVNKWGGAERVLLSLNKIFPEAPLYTSVYDSKEAPWAKVFPEVIPSYLQKIPFARKNHEYLAPFMPSAFESHNFSAYKLVISVTSEAAKGIITSPKTIHICYCLTPTRYLWSGHNEYFNNKTKNLLSKPLLFYLRKWDINASSRPDHIIAISSEVKKRVKKYYNRDVQIIYPPVDVDKFNSKSTYKDKDYFLLVSRLVQYKKVDLIIDVFNTLKLPLVIVGEGRLEKSLKARANKNIKFLKRLTDKELANYYKESKALLFPQIEDFGIVAVEAQAAGTPVIAFRGGGALETVIEGKTGVFFDRQDKKSIIQTTQEFLNMKFNRNEIIKNSLRFSENRFKSEFMNYMNNII